jgi:hypothetical protein
MTSSATVKAIAFGGYAVAFRMSQMPLLRRPAAWRGMAGRSPPFMAAARNSKTSSRSGGPAREALEAEATIDQE